MIYITILSFILLALIALRLKGYFGGFSMLRGIKEALTTSVTKEVVRREDIEKYLPKATRRELMRAKGRLASEKEKRKEMQERLTKTVKYDPEEAMRNETKKVISRLRDRHTRITFPKGTKIVFKDPVSFPLKEFLMGRRDVWFAYEVDGGKEEWVGGDPLSYAVLGNFAENLKNGLLFVNYYHKELA